MVSILRRLGWGIKWRSWVFIGHRTLSFSIFLILNVVIGWGHHKQLLVSSCRERPRKILSVSGSTVRVIR
jgi:hypothetical protein